MDVEAVIAAAAVGCTAIGIQDDVITCVTFDGICSASPLNDIIPYAADEDVIAAATCEGVVACAAVEVIVIAAACDGVVTGTEQKVRTLKPADSDAVRQGCGVGRRQRPVDRGRLITPVGGKTVA